jgi:hypothetical protein
MISLMHAGNFEHMRMNSVNTVSVSYTTSIADNLAIAMVLDHYRCVVSLQCET